MARSQTATTYLSNNNATVAGYIATAKLMSDAIKAVLTQTTDTGQVVWSGTGVVTTLPTSQTIRDYEIYRFNDSLQSTSPIFLRIDYLYSTQNFTTNWFAWRVGTGTDGAGNLLNSTAIQYTSSVINGFGGLMAYTSTGDGSQFVVLQNVNPTNTGADYYGAFVVERFRNADGTPNAEGYNAWAWGSQGSLGVFQMNASRNNISSPSLIVEPGPPVVVPTVTMLSSTFSGSTAIAFPFYTWGPLLRGASQAVMMGYSADWPRLQEISLTHYAKAMKFLPLGSAQPNHPLPYMSGQSGAVRSVFAPLFRWE